MSLDPILGSDTWLYISLYPESIALNVIFRIRICSPNWLITGSRSGYALLIGWFPKPIHTIHTLRLGYWSRGGPRGWVPWPSPPPGTRICPGFKPDKLKSFDHLCVCHPPWKNPVSAPALECIRAITARPINCRNHSTYETISWMHIVYTLGCMILEKLAWAQNPVWYYDVSSSLGFFLT